MDFQELLNIAAENNKLAQKEVVVNKRYSTKIPPPKKEKRGSVNHAAIRARLEKKQEQIQQKAAEEEAKKKELLRLRAESKTKGKPAGKTKTSTRPPSDLRKRDYEDEKHEQRHKTFMKKVHNVSERTKKEEPKPVSKVESDRPKKPKKASAAPKGPMSYDQLLALAASQQNGDGQSEGRSKVTKASGSSKEPTAVPSERTNSKQDDMSLKKAAAARKLGEVRRKEFLDQRKGGDTGAKNSSRKQEKNNVTSQPQRTNGKVTSQTETRVNTSSFKKPERLSSKPETSTSKTKHSPATSSKTVSQVAGRRLNGASSSSSDRLKQTRKEPESKRPASLKQSRVEEYFEKKPSGSRPNPVPQRQPPPTRQSKLDKYYDQAPSTSRQRPGLDRRAPSVGGQMVRKRPASSTPPSFRAKYGRLLSEEEESDYEDDDLIDFIDNTPLDDGGTDVSSYIKEIFGYDKSKYEYESDYQIRNMDASFSEIQREEARSSRLGMQEDLEDIRREKEENKRLKMKAAAKMKSVGKKKPR